MKVEKSSWQIEICGGLSPIFLFFNRSAFLTCLTLLLSCSWMMSLFAFDISFHFHERSEKKLSENWHSTVSIWSKLWFWSYLLANWWEKSVKFHFQSCSSLYFFNDQKIWREIQNFWRCLLSWTQLRFSVSWSGENRYERKSSSIINKTICLNYKTGFRLIQKIAPLKIEFELSKTVYNYCNKKYCENIKYFINLPNIFRLSLPLFTFSF